MITVTEEAALRDAERADAAAAEGQWLGLLHGMTVAVKDNIDTAGVRTTAGAKFLADHIPNADAPVVQRLRSNGAVIVGKATMHELAFGIRSENPVAGVCRNPWALDRVPGGSSGGSGAAVAAGMCEGALGTDTGGSVRLPATINGVAGLRPTHGRLPIRGILPVSVTNDTVGPMARPDCSRRSTGTTRTIRSRSKGRWRIFCRRWARGSRGSASAFPIHSFSKICTRTWKPPCAPPPRTWKTSARSWKT